MLPSKIMKQLQADAELYLMFWDEWTKSEYCFLNDTEIKMMDTIKKKDFSVRISELGKFFREEKSIRKLDQKLQNELHLYKEWIAFSFLMSLVKISKNKGGEAFFYEQINKLDIPQNLKNHLAKMRVSTLKELIDKHSDTYLVINPLFEHIVNFKLSYAKEYNC
jgi:hypothetical protein